MKLQKKHPRTRRKDTSEPARPEPEPEEPRPVHIDWSEPAEPERTTSYDIERNNVPRAPGPDEPEVDRSLEH